MRIAISVACMMLNVGVICAQNNKRIQVACVISKNTTEIDYVGPQAVFQTWHFDSTENRHMKRFNIFTVSETREVVDGRVADFTFEDSPVPDIVIIPAQRGSLTLTEWLKKVYPEVDYLMSVCTGAKHLAKTGLLDGKTATTHHGAVERFKKEFPSVNWIENVRFTRVSDKIYTSGGLTSGIDLALHILEIYFGRGQAQIVADHLEYQGNGWKYPEK